MSTAIVTSSYRGDFERCRLLCESIDRRVRGFTTHYILVEPQDFALFASLAGPRRVVVDERDLLPRFLRPFPDPIHLGRRRIWISAYGPPLRGWHVQQLRRLAMAAQIDDTVMVSIDSDVVFLRDFDVGGFRVGEKVNLFRRQGAIAAIDEPGRSEHREWVRTADRILGLEAAPQDDTDYVTTLLSWRTDTVRHLRAHIEARHARDWIKVLAGTRALSECMLYGRFVDWVEGRPDRHEPTSAELCVIYWAGASMDAAGLKTFAGALEPGQVAVGIQSFTATDPALIRQVAGLA